MFDPSNGAGCSFGGFSEFEQTNHERYTTSVCRSSKALSLVHVARTYVLHSSLYVPLAAHIAAWGIFLIKELKFLPLHTSRFETFEYLDSHYKSPLSYL
jgi:hypothetical protein